MGRTEDPQFFKQSMKCKQMVSAVAWEMFSIFYLSLSISLPESVEHSGTSRNRRRIFLQNINFLLLHVSGKFSQVYDTLSFTLINIIHTGTTSVPLVSCNIYLMTHVAHNSLFKHVFGSISSLFLKVSSETMKSLKFDSTYKLRHQADSSITCTKRNTVPFSR